MWSAKETAVTKHGMIAGVGFVVCHQFDLGCGVRDRRKTFQAD
jgi:hypothetical protein